MFSPSTAAGRAVKAGLALAAVAAVLFLAGFVTWQRENALSDYGRMIAALDARVETIQTHPAGPAGLVRLPEDGLAYHVSLFVADDWREKPKQRELVAAWKSNPTLVAVAAQTHFHLYTPTMAIYRARYARTLPGLPAVRIQDATGKVHFQLSGEKIPRDPGRLAELVAQIFRRPCPQPSPTPQPTPKPDPDPMPDMGPILDLPGEPTDADQAPAQEAGFPWLALLATVGVSGAGAAYWQLRREFSRQMK